MADAGAANAIDPTAKLLQQRGMFVWVMIVFTGLQQGPICTFFLCVCARLWTLSGSYARHKDVDSYTNTSIDSGVCPGRAEMAAR